MRCVFSKLTVDCTLGEAGAYAPQLFFPCCHGQDAAKKASTEKESFSSMEAGCDRQRNLMFVALVHLEIGDTIYNLAVGCQDERAGWTLRCSRHKITLSQVAILCGGEDVVVADRMQRINAPMAPILSTHGAQSSCHTIHIESKALSKSYCKIANCNVAHTCLSRDIRGFPVALLSRP